MKTKSICIVFFMLFSFSYETYSQDSLNVKKITGKLLITKYDYNFEYTTIDIYQANNHISTILTDKYGSFNLVLSDTIKSITLKSLMFEDLLINLVGYQSSEIYLEDIYLNFKTELKEVIINAKQLGEYSVDKRTFKVKPVKNASSPTLENFIITLPSIIYRDGIFLIDGRKKVNFYMNGIQISNEVAKSLSSEIIDKVELITSSAFGNLLHKDESMINIITKKESESKVGGNLSAELGLLRSSNSILNNTYIITKKNFFNFNFNTYNNNYTEYRESHWINNQTNSKIFSDNITSQYSLLPLFSSFYSNIKLNKKILISSNIRHNIQKINYNAFSNLFENNTSDEVTNIYTNLKKDSFLNNQIRYEKDTLSYFTFDISLSKTSIKKNINTYYSDNSFLSADTSSVKNFSNQFCYYYNSKNKKNHIETGIIYSNYFYNIEFSQKQAKKTQSFFKPISGKSIYNSDIIGFFSRVKTTIKSGTLNIGVRIEKTRLVSKNADTVINDNRFLYLIPDVSFFFPTNKLGMFIFSYDKSITMPNLDNINLTQTITKPNIIRSGNLSILPEITNNFQVYNFNNVGNTEFVSNIYFSNTQNYIENDGFSINENTISTNYNNIGNLRIIGVNLSSKLNLETLPLNLNIKVEKYFYESEKKLNTNNTNGLQFEIDLQSNYTINPSSSLNFSVNYRNIEYTPTWIKKFKGPTLGFSFNKNIKKLYATLTYNSMFNWSNKLKYIYESKVVNGQYNEFSNMQNISLSLTYNFGKVINNTDNSAKSVEPRKIKK